MYHHLLVPIDGSELWQRATEASLELARKVGARVTGFVVEPHPPLPGMGSHPAAYARDADEHLVRTEAHAHEVLGQFAAQAAAQGVPFAGQFKRTERVDDAILDAAAEYGCDLIVMVTHGRGVFGELLFGSHTKTLLARTRLPLLVLH
ncbi:MAG: universal stress protein [Rubrivivax sp.]|nr:universal stress protein [Rubrivivax sp.]